MDDEAPLAKFATSERSVAKSPSKDRATAAFGNEVVENLPTVEALMVREEPSPIRVQKSNTSFLSNNRKDASIHGTSQNYGKQYEDSSDGGEIDDSQNVQRVVY